MSKAVGIIPARWNSTRFPGKPLHPIAGKPLLKHVWERCLRAKNLDLVVIATDDMRIASAAFEWGAEVALTSPKHRSGTNRVAEVARKTKQFAYVINIQGDEPLIDPRLIDKVVEKLRSDRKVGIVTAAHPFEDPADASSPHQVKVVLDLRGNALYFSRAPIPVQPKDARRCFQPTDNDKGALATALLVSSSPGNLRIPARDAAAICEMETKSAGAQLNRSNNCAHWKMV